VVVKFWFACTETQYAPGPSGTGVRRGTTKSSGSGLPVKVRFSRSAIVVPGKAPGVGVEADVH
jgi:hypothetical protein